VRIGLFWTDTGHGIAGGVSQPIVNAETDVSTSHIIIHGNMQTAAGRPTASPEYRMGERLSQQRSDQIRFRFVYRAILG
jgi:hypothetical protein